MEYLKLDSERWKFAHEKQFIKEFKLYEDIWEPLSNLKDYINALHHEYYIKLSPKEKDEINTRDLKNVEKTINTVLEIAVLNAPFIHERVYAELMKFSAMCTSNMVEKEFFEESSSIVEAAPDERQIERQLDRISEEIRWRIGLSTF